MQKLLLEPFAQIHAAVGQHPALASEIGQAQKLRQARVPAAGRHADIEQAQARVAQAGVIRLRLGGDHQIDLPVVQLDQQLRAQQRVDVKARHGPVHMEVGQQRRDQRRHQMRQ
ncbi:hypothetical protein D3C78_1472930 [compost metagenome]